MPRLNGVLIAYCGLVCQLCPAYRHKACPGCDSHVGVCYFATCASHKGLKCCFLCPKFPCQAHYEGFDWETPKHGKLRWRIFSRVFLRVFSKPKSTRSQGH